MTYNSDQVYNNIYDPLNHARKAQVGVDLTVAKIEKIEGIAIFEGDSKLNRDLIKYEEALVLTPDALDKTLEDLTKETSKSLDLIEKFHMISFILDSDTQSEFDKIQAEIDKAGGIENIKNEANKTFDTLKEIFSNMLTSGQKIYMLEPNTAYVIEFEQGVEFKDNEWGYISIRSSLNRTGTRISSAIWDPLFKTDKMGTTLLTGPIPVFLPAGTRIAQMLIFECTPVTEGYNGQWQGVANHT